MNKLIFLNLDSIYNLGGVQSSECKSRKAIIFGENLDFIYLGCVRDLKCKNLDSNNYHFKCSKKSNLFYTSRSNNATHNKDIDSSHNLSEMYRLWCKSAKLDSIYNSIEDNSLEHTSDNLESRVNLESRFSNYRGASNSHFIIASLSNKAKQFIELDSKKSESSKYLESQKTENIDSKLDYKNIDYRKDCREGLATACNDKILDCHALLNDKVSNSKNLDYKTQRLLYVC